jgi:hypothetical protein
MGMGFATWNVRRMYRAVAEEISKNEIFWEYRSDGIEVAPNQQANIHFSMEGE